MLKKIYSLINGVNAAMNDNITETWQRLQCADYFYYLKKGCGHDSSNPYPSEEAAYKNYNNIITDFEISVIQYNLDKFKYRALSNNL